MFLFVTQHGKAGADQPGQQLHDGVFCFAGQGDEECRGFLAAVGDFYVKNVRLPAELNLRVVGGAEKIDAHPAVGTQAGANAIHRP